MYEVTSDDLCSQAFADAVGTRLGLEEAHSSRGDPVDDSERWTNWCAFSGLWTDERFLTELGPAGPIGTFSLYVYADAGKARDLYRRSSQGVRAEVVPTGSVTEIEGWWEGGWRMQWHEQMGGPSIGIDDLDTVVVHTSFYVQHHNLIIRGSTRAIVPGPMRDEGHRVLIDLDRQLIEEGRRQVTLSTDA